MFREINSKIKCVATARTMCDIVETRNPGGNVCFFFDGTSLFKVKVISLLDNTKANIECEKVNVKLECSWCGSDAEKEEYYFCDDCGHCWHKRCQQNEAENVEECAQCEDELILIHQPTWAEKQSKRIDQSYRIVQKSLEALEET